VQAKLLAARLNLDWENLDAATILGVLCEVLQRQADSTPPAAKLDEGEGNGGAGGATPPPRAAAIPNEPQTAQTSPPGELERAKIMPEVRQETPKPEPLDLTAIQQAARELGEVIKAYDAGSQPNVKWWGVLINRLWHLDRGLNPERRKYGDRHRDEHIDKLPVLQSAPLSRIRTAVDAVAVTFKLERVFGRDSLESVLATARELAKAADYRAIRIDRAWADELHDAAGALSQPAAAVPEPAAPGEPHVVQSGPTQPREDAGKAATGNGPTRTTKGEVMASLAKVNLQLTAVRKLCALCYEWRRANPRDGRSQESFFSKTYPPPAYGGSYVSPTVDQFNEAIAGVVRSGYRRTWLSLSPSNIESMIPKIEDAIGKLECRRAGLLGTPPTPTPDQDEGTNAAGSTLMPPPGSPERGEGTGPGRPDQTKGEAVNDSSPLLVGLEKAFENVSSALGRVLDSWCCDRDLSLHNDLAALVTAVNSLREAASTGVVRSVISPANQSAHECLTHLLCAVQDACLAAVTVAEHTEPRDYSEEKGLTWRFRDRPPGAPLHVYPVGVDVGTCCNDIFKFPTLARELRDAARRVRTQRLVGTVPPPAAKPDEGEGNGRGGSTPGQATDNIGSTAQADVPNPDKWYTLDCYTGRGVDFRVPLNDRRIKSLKVQLAHALAAAGLPWDARGFDYIEPFVTTQLARRGAPACDVRKMPVADILEWLCKTPKPGEGEGKGDIMQQQPSASCSPADRLRELSEKMRALPEALRAFSAWEKEVAQAAARILDEAMGLGALPAREFRKLHILIERVKARSPDDWWNIWSEAITCLAPELHEHLDRVRAVIPACDVIADLLAREADRLAKEPQPASKPNHAEQSGGAGAGPLSSVATAPGVSQGAQSPQAEDQGNENAIPPGGVEHAGGPSPEPDPATGDVPAPGKPQVRPPKSEVSTPESPEETRQSDIGSDTPKKTPLKMTKEAATCADLYRKAKRSDPDTSMKDVVSDYTKENGGSKTYIMRVLNDNPDQWKTPARQAAKKR
jgi:hypothetical protein